MLPELIRRRLPSEEAYLQVVPHHLAQGNQVLLVKDGTERMTAVEYSFGIH